MCKCDKELINNDINGFHTLDISKADDCDRYGLVMITPFGMHSIEIFFCPMCGEKLGDNNE